MAAASAEELTRLADQLRAEKDAELKRMEEQLKRDYDSKLVELQVLPLDTMDAVLAP